ncbi:hypothetical protein [Nostoc sp.]|uniref:hypothetical protein n=1 Tax=Nostoc sp. TaxID=1180 RepID=UPI003593A779
MDLGFEGLEQKYDNIHLPHRKPRGGELSETQKQDKCLLNQSCVLCKNAFALCQALQRRQGDLAQPNRGL